MSQFGRLADACRAVLSSDDEHLELATTEALIALRSFVGGNGMHFVLDQAVFHGHAHHGPRGHHKFTGHEDVRPTCIIDMFVKDPRWQRLVRCAEPTVFTQQSDPFPQLRERFVAGGVRSMMIVPFQYRESPAGYFAFFARDNPFRLQPGDVAALHATCDAVGHSIALRSHRSQLDQSLRRYELLLEMSDECAIELDSDGVIRFVAPSWQRLTGWTFDQVLGRELTDLLVKPPSSLGAFLAAGEQGASLRCRGRIDTAIGPRPVELFLQQRESDSGNAAIQGCLRLTSAGADSRDSLTEILDLLTSKEQEVVLLLLDGHRVNGIADQLFLSRHTVRNHLKRIFRKVGVSSQQELVGRCRAATSPVSTEAG